MKLKQSNNVVETNNVTKGNTFGIKNSSKTFAILSSGLYSNKIEAVLRELSCNANDSHTARNQLIESGNSSKYLAHKDKNFRVTFPTSFDPYFTVRDFGIGLTPDEVENIYTVYFESTKQDSNDYVGALGLGSKSPFAYSTSFTVTATKDGHRAIYTMFINEEGVPQPALIDQGPVETFFAPGEEIPDEEFFNGVEVKVPAADYDSLSFETAARNVFQYFEVCPELVNYNNHGSITFFKDKEATTKITDGVYIVPTVGYSNKQYALQGNVSYPIELTSNDFSRVVTDTEDDDDVTYTKEYIDGLFHFYDKLCSSRLSFVFEFNIGDLDVAASREELSYDTSTILAIVKKIDDLYTQIDDIFDTHMEQFETKWEKARELLKISSSGNSLIELFYVTQVHIRYLEKENIPMVNVREGYRHSRSGIAYNEDYITFTVPNEDNIVVRTCNRTRGKRLSVVSPGAEDSPVGLHMTKESTLIVINDTKRGAARFSKEYFVSVSGATNLILLEPSKLGNDIKPIQEYLSKIELKLDEPKIPVKYVSAIKKEFPEFEVKYARPKNSNGYYSLYSDYTVAQIMPDTGDLSGNKAVYIPYKNQRPTLCNLNVKGSVIENMSIDKMVEVLDQIRKMDDSKSITVIGLNQNMLKQVSDEELWLPINEYIEQQFNELFKDPSKQKEIEESITKKLRHNNLLSSVNLPFGSRTIAAINSRIIKLEGLDDFKEAFSVLNKGKENLTVKEEIYKSVTGFTIESNHTSNDIMSNYPMLKYMSSEYSWSSVASDEKINDIIEYCIACNKGDKK